MAGGRPIEYDYVAESKKLLEWAELESSINLYGFTKTQPYCAQQLQDFAKACPEFSVALIKTKEILAYRREEKLSKGELHQAAWNRTVRNYDKILRDEEEATKDLDAARQAKINSTVQPAQIYVTPSTNLVNGNDTK